MFGQSTRGIDELVDQGREVADGIETVAAADEEQTTRIQEMSETVQRQTQRDDPGTPSSMNPYKREGVNTAVVSR